MLPVDIFYGRENASLQCLHAHFLGLLLDGI